MSHATHLRKWEITRHSAVHGAEHIKHLLQELNSLLRLLKQSARAVSSVPTTQAQSPCPAIIYAKVIVANTPLNLLVDTGASFPDVHRHVLGALQSSSIVCFKHPAHQHGALSTAVLSSVLLPRSPPC